MEANPATQYSRRLAATELQERGASPDDAQRLTRVDRNLQEAFLSVRHLTEWTSPQGTHLRFGLLTPAEVAAETRRVLGDPGVRLFVWPVAVTA